MKKNFSSITKQTNIPITKTQIEFALYITNKLMNYPISYFLRTSSEFENAASLEKLAKIRSLHPLYFSSIISNINDSVYKTLEEWKNDMNKLFGNVLTYFPESSPYAQITIELQNKFLEKIKKSPTNSSDFWIYKLDKSNKKLQKCLNQFNTLNFDSETKLNSENTEKPHKIVLHKKKEAT